MAFFVCLVSRLFGLWFLITGLLMIFRKPKGYEQKEPRTGFACLIPARDEEQVIGRSVGSLLAQDYPRGLFEVFVIPNNCSDGTEAAALAAGAKVLNVAGPVSCKGDVLKQAVRSDEVRGFDAVMVFDADNYVSRDYLSRMNDAFCAGARVAKGRLRALNTRNSWVAGCYALYFGIFDWFFNRSRAALSMSAKLVGTGFAVSLGFLEEAGGWNTGTIAEDAEFSAICAERGEKVWWVPEAVSYDEAPHSFKESLRQRRRWVSGIMDVSERKAAGLFAASGRFLAPPAKRREKDVKAGNCRPDQRIRREGRLRAARAFDSAMFLCSPFMQAVSPILSLPAALQGAKVIVGKMGLLAYIAEAASMPSEGETYALLGAALAFAVIGWLGITAFGVLVAALSGYRPSVIAGGVVMFPLFMASWFPLIVISLFFRTRKWKQIRHG